jgi:hypothetical protein
MQAAANHFMALDGRRTRERCAFNNFFVVPAHGDKKSLIPVFGKGRLAIFYRQPAGGNPFLLKQSLQKLARPDSFHVLLKNLCQ